MRAARSPNSANLAIRSKNAGKTSPTPPQASKYLFLAGSMVYQDDFAMPRAPRFLFDFAGATNW
jgi:hypothetical protein